MDISGRPVRLLGMVRQLLHDLKTSSDWTETNVAWVSCTDEPDWAAMLLRQFKTAGGDSIGSVAHSSQIFKNNKRVHFQRLKSQYQDIEYEEMLFFDNESGNIRDVSSLGVKCVYCPSGVTQAAWQDGLNLFNK